MNTENRRWYYIYLYFTITVACFSLFCVAVFIIKYYEQKISILNEDIKGSSSSIWPPRNQHGVTGNKKVCSQAVLCQLEMDVISFMNESVSPCTNFFEYTTGRGNQHSYFNFISPKSNLSLFYQMGLDVRRDIIHIFDANETLCTTCNAGRKARRFYTSCIMDYNLTVSHANNDLDENKISCFTDTLSYFPDVVNQMYITERKISTNNRTELIEIYKTIKETFKLWILKMPWIDSVAKHEIVIKLERLSFVLGYPPNILETNVVDQRYINLTIKKDNYIHNVDEFELKEVKPQLTREEYSVINPIPYYDPKEDKIFLPAAIMRYPVYHSKFPDVIKYARIGFIIAHELTHAFREYYRHTQNNVDADDASVCVEKSYPNGKLTMEENYADIVGLNVSFDAWKSIPNKGDYKILPGLNHFSENKIFFIAWAQMWPGNFGHIIDDYHSTHDVRVKGVIAHSEEFSHSFHCFPEFEEDHVKCF